ncbi:hypothetical protein AWC20_23745 [Mycobacterium parmense]|nr:hypothetical protein AWC20_23745 [Mycobacterium parmense]
MVARSIGEQQLQRAREHLRQAARRAVAAQLAAADELERFADLHDAAARAHEVAGADFVDDLLLIAHVHVAEMHRSAARAKRALARECRDQAQQCSWEL